MSYKIVAIKEMSARNDTVGEMWKETKIFENTDSIHDVMKWAGTKKQVTITIPENSIDDFDEAMPF